jgi:nucleotide-binding universal stress UspA family protein
MTATSPSPVLLVALDFSETGNHALNEALLWLSERPNAVAHVVHVAAAYGPMLRLDLADDVKTVSQEELEQFLSEHVQARVAAFASQHGALAGDRVRTHVRVGVPSDEIVAFAAELEADVVVVGTHRRHGVARLLLGSVAEAVVRKAGCKVLVVRPKDYPPEAPEDERESTT